MFVINLSMQLTKSDAVNDKITLDNEAEFLIPEGIKSENFLYSKLKSSSFHRNKRIYELALKKECESGDDSMLSELSKEICRLARILDDIDDVIVYDIEGYSVFRAMPIPAIGKEQSSDLDKIVLKYSAIADVAKEILEARLEEIREKKANKTA